MAVWLMAPTHSGLKMYFSDYVTPALLLLKHDGIIHPTKAMIQG